MVEHHPHAGLHAANVVCIALLDKGIQSTTTQEYCRAIREPVYLHCIRSTYPGVYVIVHSR